VDLAGIGEHSDGAISDGNGLTGGIAFAAGFEKVFETGIRT
jgi:hypothetical protein